MHSTYSRVMWYRKHRNHDTHDGKNLLYIFSTDDTRQYCIESVLFIEYYILIPNYSIIRHEWSLCNKTVYINR